jgi:hypothetical protein
VHYKAIGAGNRTDTRKRIHMDVARKDPGSWKVPNESERDRMICNVGGIRDHPCVSGDVRDSMRATHGCRLGEGEKNENEGWE